jgi:hypothetical protein
VQNYWGQEQDHGRNPQLLDQAAALAVLPKMRGKIVQVFKIDTFLGLQIVARESIN